MPPPQSNNGPQGHFEDQMRGLMLSNTEDAVNPAGQGPVQSGSSFNGHPSQLDTTLSPTPGAAQEPDKSLPASQKPPGRKRPNQAQRRQMSAQLSIPIDPRPAPASQPGRQYHGMNGWGQNQSRGQPPNSQRPQTATFRPSHYDQGFQQAPNHGRGYPAQPRHQQSQSYHGPPSQSFSDWRQQAPGPPSDSATRGHHASFSGRGAGPLGFSRNSHSMSHHQNRQHVVRPEDVKAQTALLEKLCNTIIVNAEIDVAHIQEKEGFRADIERICQHAITQFERETNGVSDFPPNSVQLKCFGSLSSGFATKAADMDLGLLSPLSKHQPDEPGSLIPRIVEKAFLDAGLGARLLTRTRVPIIKLCQVPPEKLRQDLLRERAKWEQGITDEHDHADADEADHDDKDRPPTQDGVAVQGEEGTEQAVKEKRSSSGNTPTGGHSNSPEAMLHRLPEAEARSFVLKQSDKQHLANYYSLAKRLLRKFGGRDITHSTAKSFRDDEYKILSDVAHAFVRGLSDERLKSRLQSYASLSQANSNNVATFRSLAGVYSQVEGEAMVMLWEDRVVFETDAEHEKLAEKQILAWKELQNKTHYGLDLLNHNKDLQLAADQLRRIPSIQLMMLEQEPYEPPGSYHSRTIKLLFQLGKHDAMPTRDQRPAISNLIIQKYVAGIWGDEVRKQVKAFASQPGSGNLRTVARRHKSLHLASEFERTVDKGLYNKQDVEVIDRYIMLLRSPLRESSPPDPHFDYTIQFPPDQAGLLEKILTVTDPATLAPNQPRDPYRDKLEFPKSGVGVQCDINFSAHLALHNTLLLRCYSYADSRVRPLVLFVKHWAKIRDINTPYRGTLSSYGYVLMVLHYLVNVAQPFVCPNLQALAQPPDPSLTQQQAAEITVCKGRNVQFWRDEEAIKRLAQDGALTQNRDSIGFLLRGFFEYYAQNGMLSTGQCRGFDWGRDVLSLRTPGGLLPKQEKGWTGAKTVIERVPAATADHAPPKTPLDAKPVTPITPMTPAATAPGNDVKSAATPKEGGEVKEVRHRYLFAIEDPFELDHNVARTVTHNGIVSIRDEFRRAWRIIRNAGNANVAPENLLQEVKDTVHTKEAFRELLAEIHGRNDILAGSGAKSATQPRA